jgi:hypothetical protein
MPSDLEKCDIARLGQMRDTGSVCGCTMHSSSQREASLPHHFARPYHDAHLRLSSSS